MESETLSAPVQTLIEYSRQNATTENVLRSLIGHQNWLAPAVMFAQNVEQTPDGAQHLSVDKPLVIFSTETRLPADELWIFTDKAAAELAQTAGALLGLYANKAAGTELFLKIDPNLKIIRVNPYSPTEQTFQFQTGSFEVLKIWAQAIALEESFARGELNFKAIADFQGFTIFNQASGYVATLPNKGGMANPAIAFTAPDCADAFLAKLDDEQRGGLSKLVVSGLTLIKKLPLQEIDGILFNTFGPGSQTYFAFTEIEDVNSLENEE